MNYEASASTGPDHYSSLIGQLDEWRARCSCSPGSDITSCPNYLPGIDDEPEDEVRFKNPRTGQWEDGGERPADPFGLDENGDPVDVEQERLEAEDAESDDEADKDDETDALANAWDQIIARREG